MHGELEKDASILGIFFKMALGGKLTSYGFKQIVWLILGPWFISLLSFIPHPCQEFISERWKKIISIDSFPG